MNSLTRLRENRPAILCLSFLLHYIGSRGFRQKHTSFYRPQA